MTLWMWWLLGAVIVLGITIGPLVLTLTPTKAERDAAKPIQLSAQQVMRNTRADLPTEYREWFDWTAELAGFERPPARPKRPKIHVDTTRDRTEIREFGSDEIVDVIYRESSKRTVVHIKDDKVIDDPDAGVRPYEGHSYGPGTGWEEDWVEGHHVWIRRQA